LGSIFADLQHEVGRFLQSRTVAEALAREAAAPSFEI
jgi:hypothetical protein